MVTIEERNEKTLEENASIVKPPRGRKRPAVN
jgi:hypothetical protein